MLSAIPPPWQAGMGTAHLLKEMMVVRFADGAHQPQNGDTTMLNSTDKIIKHKTGLLSEGKPDVRSVERLQEKIASIQDRRTRPESHAGTLEESGEDQLSLTAPPARAMHTGTRTGVGYNIRIAGDTKNRSIAGQQVHNTVGDPGLFAARQTR